ncbi:MAG: hemolysin III family protein [Actinomycetota bacterium]|nr:hemolysin III family protein [Actinomycetota bacterium]
MSHTLAPDPGPKPLLRGWAHLISFPLWLIVGVSMVTLANTTATGRVLLAVYVGGTAVMFGVSAMYHRGRWQPQAKLLMQKFDRSAIFLAIAGGYTPIAWVSLHGTTRIVMLAGAWAGALLGIVLHWLPRVPRTWRGASYIVVSWAAVAVFPQMRQSLGATGFWLILFGGACYTIGALSLATKWPNPWPRVFGFHEVFHAFTVVAAGVQFVAISVIVAPRI